jgi:hypothetical protein
MQLRGVQMRELTVEERESIGGGADWNGNGVDDQYEHNVESIGVTSTPPTSGGYDYSSYMGAGGNHWTWTRYALC